MFEWQPSLSLLLSVLMKFFVLARRSGCDNNGSRPIINHRPCSLTLAAAAVICWGDSLMMLHADLCRSRWPRSVHLSVWISVCVWVCVVLFASVSTLTAPCAASVAAVCPRWCHCIHRWRFPPGWAWWACLTFPAGPLRWGRGWSLAGATSPARWATDDERRVRWAEVSSVCSLPTPAEWSLWKAVWSACRGWGSGRC